MFSLQTALTKIGLGLMLIGSIMAPRVARADELALFDQAIEPFADGLSAFVFFAVPIGAFKVPVVVLLLVSMAVFMTVYFRLINLWGLPYALKVLFPDNRREKCTQEKKGELTHLQALTTALSGTVGIGNIGGVAIAITVGGPGAVFWMVLAGVLGMATKFAECTLAVKFREVSPTGEISGGPMFYLRHGLAARGWPRLGKGIGGFYAFGIVFGCLGIGNMFQANQAFVQISSIVPAHLENLFAQYHWVVGLIMAGTIGAIIVGGIKSIGRVTEALVPGMALLYLAGCLAILWLNREALPYAVETIFTSAFTYNSVSGGLIGSMMVGFQRAVFSNEAGIGSAAIAHSTAATDAPATEGLVALFEPLIDTVVICTITSLVIVTTTFFEPDFLGRKAGGIALTSQAFERHVAWAPYFIAVAGFLFAISTMISWSFYGLKGWTYLVGNGNLQTKLFQLAFCFFIVVGTQVEVDNVLKISDALVFLICVPNLLGLMLLAPEVKGELNRYIASSNKARQDPQAVLAATSKPVN